MARYGKETRETLQLLALGDGYLYKFADTGKPRFYYDIDGMGPYLTEAKVEVLHNMGLIQLASCDQPAHATYVLSVAGLFALEAAWLDRALPTDSKIAAFIVEMKSRLDDAAAAAKSVALHPGG